MYYPTWSVLNAEWFVVPCHFLLPLQHDGLHHRVNNKQGYTVQLLKGIFARVNYLQCAVNREFCVYHLLYVVVDLLDFLTV